MRKINGKKAIASFELVLLISGLFAFSYLIYMSSPVSATLSEPSYCCEKTVSGNFCINAPESQCNSNFRSAPTSCETTSYCRLGTCYDSREGICMENTPQIVCEQSGGTWDRRPISEVAQCQLGCCIIAEQAAFVSLVRCKRLSTFFGVENNYRTDITNEIDCIATAQGQDMGACVYEKDFDTVCKFTTRDDCGASNVLETVNASDNLGGSRKFYKDYLCSAEELNTACARQTTTGCYQGKVYWFDSCGNRENVYSTDKIRSWNNGRVENPDNICRSNDGSNKNCGNCEYLLGSRCAEFSGLVGRPSDGNYYCQKTECKDREGNKRMNGESWCVHDGPEGEGKEQAGARYYREVCIDGSVRVEPCADFRNEICIESSIETELGTFGTAGCRVNRWQDCVLQMEEEDCSNIDRRDCMWLPSVTGMILGGGESSGSGVVGFSNPTAGGSFNNPSATGITGRATAPITGAFLGLGGDGDDESTERTVTNRPDGICVPNYAPGLDFWNSGGSAQTVCSQASAKCIVVYEKTLTGGTKCVENCHCEEEGWALEANRVCVALGDCGAYVNYNKAYTEDGYTWKIDGKKNKFSPSIQNRIRGGFTGMAVATLFMAADIVGFERYTTYYENLIAQGYTPDNSGLNLIKQGASPVDISYAKSIGAKEGLNFVEGAGGGLTNIPTTGEFAGGQSKLAEIFGFEAGSGASAIASGLQWAGIAYVAGYMVGSMFGMTKDNTKALSMSMAGGFGTYKMISSYNFAGGGFLGPESFIAKHPALVGAGVGIAIFVLMYKKVETVTVTFDCMPWQAPVGVDEKTCEICNDDNLPCSEYRCRSLGQSCELINPGSDQEMCVNVNPNDVDPPVIRPNEADLTQGHAYTNVRLSPPGPGFTIVNRNSTDGCLKAFTPLQFGITVDEPAQCKIDFNHTTSFDDMSNYFGGSNLYSYNHTEQFSLPGAKDLENAGFVLQNGKDLTFYIRCRDRGTSEGKGSTNEAEYAVRFCIDPSPDTTPPRIVATSVINEGCVAEGSENAVVEFYTNEPATCKWSKTDQSYANMQNEMTCSANVYQINAQQLFTCRANLTGVGRDMTDFFVRCKDLPNAPENDRNEMMQSTKFSLRGSTGLKIMKMNPNGTIFGGINPTLVELYVETQFGCDKGRSVCFYSTTGVERDYIMFFDTDNSDGVHTQRLDLFGGNHKYFIKCVDSGGNLVEDTLEFRLDIDTNAPVIARIYEEDQMLKIVTLRDSECSYSTESCDFTFDEGIEMPYANTPVHVVSWDKENTYYIKCRDEFRSEDATCSVIVRPTRKLF